MLRLAAQRLQPSRRSLSSCPLCLSRSASSTSTSSRPTTLPPPSLDLAPILANPSRIKQNLLDRNYPLDPSVVDELTALETEAKGVRKELQAARERRNAAAGAGGKGQQATEEARKEGAELKKLLKRLEPHLAGLEKQLQHLALQLPNTSHEASPVGDEDQAITVKTFGPSIPSPPPSAIPSLDHLALTSPSGSLSSSSSTPGKPWTDFPSSTLTSGPSWPLLLNSGALLELALTQYAFSRTLHRGFSPVLTPDVVRAEVAERCGFRPRDGEAQQTYFLSDGTPEGAKEAGLVLAGTAEVPLVAMSAARIFEAKELPLRQVALGRAFRAEAGARGADSRGLYRVHQFSKVEMVVVCTEEQSGELLEELRSLQEEILSGLGLSLRVLDMPTQELGASAHRKYDIEAWMPGRGKWGELSSASNCTDYQSRRLGIRYRPSTTTSAPSKTLFAHTLNATAAAIPRLIVALVENGAVLGEKGEVVKMRLPGCLRRFWLGSGELGVVEEGGVIEWVEEGEALRVEGP
ncbi:hypothetical protein BCR35DRAFT_298982 [Leucosporidium creatinivorum]|uniref:serine--tRNA ligase n=1 Tax=Leucosporidium creatinivorum TaxID=106004 RepID=A0A1Y2G414_9BASI|nr:hypothetical protein BCR35DRAFT_298982 [Leucosporidium creatinivorum]